MLRRESRHKDGESHLNRLVYQRLAVRGLHDLVCSLLHDDLVAGGGSGILNGDHLDGLEAPVRSVHHLQLANYYVVKVNPLWIEYDRGCVGKVNKRPKSTNLPAVPARYSPARW